MFNLKASIKTMIDYQKIQDLARQSAAKIMVGFPAGRQHISNKQSNAKGPGDIQPMEVDTLATILTYGSADIPARPFLAEGILDQKTRLRDEIMTQAKKEFESKQANWDKVGVMAVGAVQEFVRGDFYKTNVPNSPRTIRQKGSDTPLIDTADLVNSVTYVVEKKE